eukprot:m.108337 g.108337  ORF g.108337 m.108337 type:complete len:125 (-) comp15905_c0_seq2:8-382(-)
MMPMAGWRVRGRRCNCSLVAIFRTDAATYHLQVDTQAVDFSSEDIPMVVVYKLLKAAGCDPQKFTFATGVQVTDVTQSERVSVYALGDETTIGDALKNFDGRPVKAEPLYTNPEQPREEPMQLF